MQTVNLKTRKKIRIRIKNLLWSFKAMALLVISSSDLRDCIGIEFLPCKVSCGDIRNMGRLQRKMRVSSGFKKLDCIRLSNFYRRYEKQGVRLTSQWKSLILHHLEKLLMKALKDRPRVPWSFHWYPQPDQEQFLASLDYTD